MSIVIQYQTDKGRHSEIKSQGCVWRVASKIDDDGHDGNDQDDGGDNHNDDDEDNDGDSDDDYNDDDDDDEGRCQQLMCIKNVP